MARYILGRLLGLLFVLFAVSLVAFFLMRAVPGGPFDIGERRLPEATRQARTEKYGLDGRSGSSTSATSGTSSRAISACPSRARPRPWSG